MIRVAVIGGGASGLVASIYAKGSNTVVDLYEKNDEIGKKILVTGNGRCNYFNEDFTSDKFYSFNKYDLSNIINNNTKEKVLSFFESIGIIPSVKNGYYYPSSFKANSIRLSLIDEVYSKGVNVFTNSFVTDILYNDNEGCFCICVNDEYKKYDKVILSTGSCAYVNSTNSYDLVKKYHSITPLLPSLVSLVGKGNYFKLWNGVRCNCEINLLGDDKTILKESGEIQLTDYGISGICVFNLSGIVNKMLYQKNKAFVSINFIPFIKDNYYEWFNSRKEMLGDRTIYEFLVTILNEKLVNTILYVTNISKNRVVNELSLDEINNIVSNLASFKLEIVSSKDFSRAQVCNGGVILDEINTNTMESLNIKNLYITGELLDVCGICGGYNLGFAFITGLLAGLDAGGKND